MKHKTFQAIDTILWNSELEFPILILININTQEKGKKSMKHKASQAIDTILWNSELEFLILILININTKEKEKRNKISMKQNISSNRYDFIKSRMMHYDERSIVRVPNQ